MPRQPPRTSETIVKSTLHSFGINHTKCNKNKPSRLVKGKVLECFFGLSAFEDEREYRVCANLMDRMKKHDTIATRTRRWRQSTSSGNTTSASEAVVSKTKNMREIQVAYRLIVELRDTSLQNAKILKKFVWMASMEHCIQFDNMALFI